MKLSWIDLILILLGLFIAYQLIKAILGGSWQTESLIIALLVFNLGIVWKLNTSIWQLKSKFEGHISWHKGRNGAPKKT